MKKAEHGTKHYMYMYVWEGGSCDVTVTDLCTD